MYIINGNITTTATCQDVDVFVDWHNNSIDWTPDQSCFAYLPSGFRIDFQLAQLSVGFENVHVSSESQMASAMADIAGSLYVCIFGDKPDNSDDIVIDEEEEEGFRW